MSKTIPVPAVLFALFMAGCAPSLDDAESVALSPESRKQVAVEGEQRKAWVLPGGVPARIDVGAVPASGAVRLALLQKDSGWNAGVRGAVYAGGRRAARFKARAGGQWRDLRLALPAWAADLEASVVTYSRKPYWLGTCEAVGPISERPNVLIVLIDALRLDHLGCYGYERDTSPHIDAFAKDAIRFTQLMPQSSWTRPVVASLFTSTYPNIHGANDRPDVLREGLPSFAQALERAGYETHGFMTNPNCLPVWGFGGDFTRYKDVESEQYLTTNDAKVVDEAIAAVRNAQGRPWYLYVHTMGPHDPYTPPAPFDKRFLRENPSPDPVQAKRERLEDLYDGEIAFTDLQIGRLFDALKETGQYDSSLVIIMADHGEEFWDHGGYAHGKTLYEEMLRVPFLVKLPGQRGAGTTCDALVEVVDIAPTILELLGLPPVEGFQGRSFAALFEGRKWTKRPGYATLLLEQKSLRAAKNGPMKYIHDRIEDQEMWFDLDRDPEERDPIEKPSDEGKGLAQYAARLDSQGLPGLHLLITGDIRTGDEITGRIVAADVGAAELRTQNEEAHVEVKGGTVQFKVETVAPRRAPHAAAPWPQHAGEQKNAHLWVDLPADEKAVLTVLRNGDPVRATSVFLGPGGEHELLYETPMFLEELAANPAGFDPDTLPRRFAVYVWYVPETEAVLDKELAPELEEALRGLGYLQ